MVNNRTVLALIACCAPLWAAAAEPYPYQELAPQQDGALPYHQIPASTEPGLPEDEADFTEISVDRISDFSDSPASDIQQMAADEYEVPATAEDARLMNEANFTEVPVDRIAKVYADPKDLYRELETGEFDNESMAEVLPMSYPAMQLPPPTVIPASAPASPPVNMIPAQRVVKRQASGEEQIFQQLTTQAIDETDAGVLTAPTPTLRRVVGPQPAPVTVLEPSGSDRP